MSVNGSWVEAQSHTGQIALRVPAAIDQLPMLRAVAETVLLTADFTIDVVTDVRVALDEVATALILSAKPGGEIECEFRYDPRQVSVRVAAVADSDGALVENSFGWHVVETLTDSMLTLCDTFDGELGGYPVEVHFSRVRSEDDDR